MFDFLPGSVVRSFRHSSIQITAKLLCFALIFLFFPLTSSAQATGIYGRSPHSTLDIYGGYGIIQPFLSGIGGHSFQNVHNMNATVSITDYLWRNLGAQVEGSYFNGPSARGIYLQCTPACSSRDAMYYTLEAGPVVRFTQRYSKVIPFAHALAGVARVNGPFTQPLTWGYGITAGGGVDYVLGSSFLHNHLAVRGQVDYQYDHANYGVVASNHLPGGVANVNAIKVSGGVVFRFRP